MLNRREIFADGIFVGPSLCRAFLRQSIKVLRRCPAIGLWGLEDTRVYEPLDSALSDSEVAFYRHRSLSNHESWPSRCPHTRGTLFGINEAIMAIIKRRPIDAVKWVLKSNIMGFQCGQRSLSAPISSSQEKSSIVKTLPSKRPDNALKRSRLRSLHFPQNRNVGCRMWTS